VPLVTVSVPEAEVVDPSNTATGIPMFPVIVPIESVMVYEALTVVPVSEDKGMVALNVPLSMIPPVRVAVPAAP